MMYSQSIHHLRVNYIKYSLLVLLFVTIRYYSLLFVTMLRTLLTITGSLFMDEILVPDVVTFSIT